KESLWVRWRGRVFAGVGLLLALVAVYFALSAFIPRWWAQRIADMSGHGSFTKGIGSGLTLGLLCTGIPLLLALWANSAHAGERVLDVEAPGFRGATAIGATVALLIFLLITFFVVRKWRRRVKSEKQQVRDAAAAAVDTATE
ncbi:permease, partial [Aduncisulcus paluster]